MAGSPKKRARRQAEAALNLPMVIPQPEPEPPETDRWGNPTEFQRAWIPRIRDMVADGATDQEIAAMLGVGRTKLYAWRIAHPELAEVMKYGKALADDRLERTAYELATGYVMTITETVKLKDKDGSEKAVSIEREVRVAPDGKMLQWLLKNRRPDTWRDKTETAHTHDVVVLTAEQARQRLAARLEQMKLAQKQPEG